MSSFFWILQLSGVSHSVASFRTGPHLASFPTSDVPNCYLKWPQQERSDVKSSSFPWESVCINWGTFHRNLLPPWKTVYCPSTDSSEKLKSSSASDWNEYCALYCCCCFKKIFLQKHRISHSWKAANTKPCQGSFLDLHTTAILGHTVLLLQVRAVWMATETAAYRAWVRTSGRRTIRACLHVICSLGFSYLIAVSQSILLYIAKGLYNGGQRI